MTISKFAKNGLLLAGLLSAPLCVASEPLYDSASLPQNIADDDKDGVINIRDFCPETVAGAKVDNDGCPTENTVEQKINLRVLFDPARYDVKPEYYSEIKKVADFMIANPTSSVIIEGHTDNLGDANKNLTLSRNRANEIALVLIRQFGIDRERIRGIGYGETRPIASNETPEGRMQNRRVVANLYASQTNQEKRWNIYSVDNMATTPSMPTPPALQFDTSSNGMPQTDLQFDTSGEATGW